MLTTDAGWGPTFTDHLGASADYICSENGPIGDTTEVHAFLVQSGPTLALQRQLAQQSNQASNCDIGRQNFTGRRHTLVEVPACMSQNRHRYKKPHK
jgi:hypothetical protein